MNSQIVSPSQKSAKHASTPASPVYDPAVPLSTPAIYDPTTRPDQTPAPKVSAKKDPEQTYDFIFKENHEPKTKSGLIGGNNILQRVLLIIGGLIVLGVIAAVAMTLLMPKENATTGIMGVIEEQQEIIRVSNLTASSATSGDVKNFAVNVSLGVGSDQTALKSYLISRKVKIDEKLLGIKEDSKTTDLLNSAKQSNTFDHAAVQSLQSILVNYRSDLNTTYPLVKGSAARDSLKSAYSSADLLITQANRLLGQQ